ncbi:MAG TPA: glycosyltransferase family 87 protein [Candidatus Binatus sp.]|jgi:alpha-1,2-mannosyltransferase|nr:glycosyltransferase family 87 protein [Candidatus Binatus sp.]
MPQPPPAWLLSAPRWLTPRRIRAQALVLAVCLWGVCAVDFATPGLFDRAGNIKFQDFLQFPIAAHLVTQGRAAELYGNRIVDDEIRTIVGRETTVHLQYFYGPQVALPFVPFERLPFLTAAELWVTLSLLAYFGCVYLTWRSCRSLRLYPGLVALCAAAYPPLFHFFVRGQISAAALLCFTAALIAFRTQRDWLAGIALGFLVFKPQFLVALPLALLLAQAWKALAGFTLSAVAQLVFTFLYFGRSVMLAYFSMLLHSASRPSTTELTLSPIQMHSLYSFWSLLISWPPGAAALYLVSAVFVIGIAAVVWKSSLPLPPRFSALILAAVLVNPHLYVYDLLSLAPALLLLVDWSVDRSVDRSVDWSRDRTSYSSAPVLRGLLYLAFVLPLVGPLARWTHLQLSVVVFAALLWTLYRIATPGHKFASAESAVV